MHLYDVSTPQSPTEVSETSPPLKASISTLDQDVYYNPHIPASAIVEFTASRLKTTSAVYLYDLAEQVGLGTLTKEWAASRSDTAAVVELQTRAGAGLSLVGRLSEGTSHDTVKGAILTAYTTPTGLSTMAPSLVHLPAASPSSRLVIQVPTVTPVGETFSLSPSLAPLASAWSILPNNIVILLSSTPQQASDFAALSYKLIQSHVIHLFDHFSSAREFGHSLTPLAAEVGDKDSNVAQIISAAGYTFFDFFGDAQAHTVVVLLNGPLARTAAALVSQTHGLALVVVNVLRPWDETDFTNVLPSLAQNIHVIDEVPHTTIQGRLYIDVFGTLLGSRADTSVQGHRFTPARTQDFLQRDGYFSRFLRDIAPTVQLSPRLLQSNVKKILVLSNPQSPLSASSRIMEDLFFSRKGFSARSLTDYDALSRPGGTSAFQLFLSSKAGLDDSCPLPLMSPLDRDSKGESDFLAILDQNLLTSHAVFQYAKRSSIVLVITDWAQEELKSHLSHETNSLILERDIRVFSINVKDIASNVTPAGSLRDLIQNVLVHMTFARLCLGVAATKSKVHNVVQSSLGDFVGGISLENINASAWDGLQEIGFTPDMSTSAEHTLKAFEFNAIAVETENGETVVNGARLASWHDAAKHLLFPAVFVPEFEPTPEEHPRNPALRPEIPERTYLVTCTVNRRLTPLEYDRNVFHVEFDTTGTGLRYAVGEALGVHGWNDEKEVLEFCAWYGVDPDRLVTIPLPGSEGKVHTRTVLQALQQQIDLFGHPPKSFYTDLAPYATFSVDQYSLLFIGSPEGSATYKKLSEKDTVTFTDVLMAYPSAKPGIEKLCELIGDIKPRHYSIASAQSVVGDRVDLLVVTVDWTTPNGRPKFYFCHPISGVDPLPGSRRYGQCTRYLDGLRIGQKVTVSIKPSVMKVRANVFALSHPNHCQHSYRPISNALSS